jgi:hypothetical protein
MDINKDQVFYIYNKNYQGRKKYIYKNDSLVCLSDNDIIPDAKTIENFCIDSTNDIINKINLNLSGDDLIFVLCIVMFLAILIYYVIFDKD